jgi:meso-butanediol dehydrogenase/(S,S)-butanediol dehydrogenase/diacetyl reductase
MRGLEGKRVVITGGAGGIGEATARRFREEDALVAVIDRDPEACRRLRKAMPDLAAVVEADVSDPDSVAAGFQALDRELGTPDVLINNAGISFRTPFVKIEVAQWRDVIATNLQGIFLMAQHAARRMLAGAGGVILNMGSTNGLAGYHYYADYNASKAGVIELTRSMALELAPMIRVNVVCPGFILTPMQEAEYTAEMQASYAAKIPLRRLGRPGDVAALFAFLASDEASYITGQSFVIDGGEIAGGLASQA